MMESDMGNGRFQQSTNDEDFSCPTPEQKLGLQKAASHGDMLDISLGSGSASSDLSPREGSALSSSLSPSSGSESEPEFFLKRRVIQEEQDKINKFGAMKLEAMVQDGMLEKRKENMYQNLLEKVFKYERELEFANKVIMTSQKEISRLRSELPESPISTGVSNNLSDQFEKSCLDDGNKVLELQNTIVRLEVSLQDSDQSNATLTEELRRTKERLQTCENEVLKLEHKLKNEIYEVNHVMQQQNNSANEAVQSLETELASERWTVSELQARVHASTDDITKLNEEIQALNFALSTSHKNFSNERSHFLSEISALSKQPKALQSKLDQAELRVKLLEDQVGQSILENLEIRDLLEAQEKQFQADINQLKTEVAQMQEQVDVLNKSLDASKFKYDMLMVRKDMLTAKVQSLNCESIHIHEMEVHLTELEAERSRLLGKLEDGEGTRCELRLKVAQLEKEAATREDVICDRAEEKREAIRQLCFSLEYYRSEYHQLCRAFSGLKRHPV